MFGAAASLATTSSEDLHFFRVERVRPLLETTEKVSNSHGTGVKENSLAVHVSNKMIYIIWHRTGTC